MELLSVQKLEQSEILKKKEMEVMFYSSRILINIEIWFIFRKLGIVSAILGNMYKQLSRSILQGRLRIERPLTWGSSVQITEEFPSLEKSMT